MGQTHTTQAETNAENTSVLHDESPHGGGRRPPAACGEVQPKPAPRHVACQYFQHLHPLVFSAFAPYCIFGSCPTLYCISWPARAKHQCFFSFPVCTAQCIYSSLRLAPDASSILLAVRRCVRSQGIDISVTWWQGPQGILKYIMCEPQEGPPQIRVSLL